jgi:hypothetical protein
LGPGSAQDASGPASGPREDPQGKQFLTNGLPIKEKSSTSSVQSRGSPADPPGLSGELESAPMSMERQGTDTGMAVEGATGLPSEAQLASPTSQERAAPSEPMLPPQQASGNGPTSDWGPGCSDGLAAQQLPLSADAAHGEASNLARLQQQLRLREEELRQRLGSGGVNSGPQFGAGQSRVSRMLLTTSDDGNMEAQVRARLGLAPRRAMSSADALRGAPAAQQLRARLMQLGTLQLPGGAASAGGGAAAGVSLSQQRRLQEQLLLQQPRRGLSIREALLRSTPGPGANGAPAEPYAAGPGASAGSLLSGPLIERTNSAPQATIDTQMAASRLRMLEQLGISPSQVGEVLFELPHCLSRSRGPLWSVSYPSSLAR